MDIVASTEVLQTSRSLNSDAQNLINEFDKGVLQDNLKLINTNPLITQVGILYEKLRNSMELREENVLLRNAIERIIKRKFLLNEKVNIGNSLLKELIWGGYFPDNAIPENAAQRINDTIRLYTILRHQMQAGLKESVRQEWMNQFMSCEIVEILGINKKKDLLADFLYRFYKEKVSISDDTTYIRDVQVYLAIRRAYCKDDLATLRYKLFISFSKGLHDNNLELIGSKFTDYYNEINKQITYPLKNKIYNYINNQVATYFILEDILILHQGADSLLTSNEENLQKAVEADCNLRYTQTKGRVRKAVIRSTIFILITKTIFAFIVEIGLESFFYGSFSWLTLILNITVPPLLMALSTFYFRKPGKQNTEKIYAMIETVLYSTTSKQKQELLLIKESQRIAPSRYIFFIILWFIAFFLSFGTLIYILNRAHFDIISQMIFIFFIAIISFIAFRIRKISKMFLFEPDKPKFLSLLSDFFFLPFMMLGRRLTENIAKINILLFIFDIFIEAPIKSLFYFLEEWFSFLRNQRDKLD